MHSLAPDELPGDTSSLGDIMEESDWEVDSDLCLPTSPPGITLTRGSALAEREIRSGIAGFSSRGSKFC